MLLFAILTAILLILSTFVILVTAVGGAAFVVVFADVIVCIWLILAIMKRMKKKR